MSHRPRPVLRGWSAWSLAVLVALIGTLGGSVAQADGAGRQQCLDAGGVWVVVDTADQLVAAGCAHHPSSGTDAVRQIGVVVQQRADGKGLICELQGLPHNACAKNGGYDKATGSYWSYWHRTSGGSPWALSDRGADTFVPPDGSTEGWRWGPGDAPRDVDAASAPVPVVKDTLVLSGPGPAVAVLLMVIVAAIALVLWRRRASRAGSEGAPEDEG